jgi:prevent-host-death family protein
MQISVEQLQTQCLELMDDVQEHHCEIIITKLGKPVAKLVPILEAQEEKGLFGYMKNSVIINDDIVKPIGEKWVADE